MPSLVCSDSRGSKIHCGQAERRTPFSPTGRHRKKAKRKKVTYFSGHSTNTTTKTLYHIIHNTTMNNHPSTAICNGNNNQQQEKHPYVLLTNPQNGTGVVFSTNQSAQGRPEWIFPKCTAEPPLMLACSAIISDYDENRHSKALPNDLQVITFDPFGNGQEQALVVRRLEKASTPPIPPTETDTDALLIAELERLYFHQPCPAGVLVVMPLLGPARTMLNLMPADVVRQSLDVKLVALLHSESQQVREMGTAAS